VLLFFASSYNLYGTFSYIGLRRRHVPARTGGFQSMVLSIPLGERIDAFFDYFP